MSIRWFIESIVTLRWLLLALILGATLATATTFYLRGGLDFDRRIENMFADDDPLLPPYQKVKRLFGGNEIVLAVYRDTSLMNADGNGIRRLSTIGERLGKVDGVKSVLSLADLDRVIAKLQRASLTGLLSKQPEPGTTIVDDENRLAAAYVDLFSGYTHGPDGETAAVICILDPVEETLSRRQTIHDLGAIIRDLPDGLEPGTIAGEPVMVIEGFSLVERDGKMLAYATLILLATTILVLFRSLRWVVIPLAVVFVTLILTQAVLVLSGLQLSMVSSMLTAIVTVVGIATVVHVIVRFREARATGRSPREALTDVGVLLAVPIFWACVTDAVGFASLMIAKVGPVQDFGVMMAIGSLMVIVSVACLVPGLCLLGKFDSDPRTAWGESRLQFGLSSLLNGVHRRPKLLAVALVLVLVFAALGLRRLQVETDFTKNFHDDNKIVESYDFVEQHLGGAGVWDVIVPAPQFMTNDYLARVRELENDLRAIERVGDDGEKRPALTKVLSLIDAIDAMEHHPTLSSSPAEARAFGMSTQMPGFFQALRSAEKDDDGHYYLRIMLRAHERQPAEQKLKLIDDVTQRSRDVFPSTENDPPADVTGFFVLLANLIQSMIRDQWYCFAFAAGAIGFVMAIAFRSLRLALIALVPNALPILVVLGGMGWLNVKINMGAAMIAAVSMGLSVDSSIHYIVSFQRAVARGLSTSDALAEVQQTVGRAVVFSTLALVVGFAALCSSEFIPTVYFGGLVSLSMVGGLVGNLVVLPLLLTLFYKRSART